MALFAPVEPNVVRLKAARNVRALIKALKYMNSSEVRKGAAAGLGELKDETAVEALIEALKDEDKFVRKNAAEALGKIGDKKALDPLIEMLKDDDWFVQEKAAAALGKIGDGRAVDPLLRFIRDVKHEHFRETARAALHAIKLREGL